ncbi:MAG: alanine racemase [Nanoarchaeales archaeon]|nr:alanine racemase [Nanoarchaeales archaeon]
MKLNLQPFKQAKNKKILVVSKYYNKEQTIEILSQTKDLKEFYGLGENRIDTIKEKNLDRNLIHFIGNIQSKKISDIVKHCSYIHSVSSLKHLELISKQIKKNNLKNMNIFIQINISQTDIKSGIEISEFENFYNKVKQFDGINILGISGMGAGEFTKSQKDLEFETLTKIKNKHPKFKISAGTSRDYKIAIEHNIDILRLGTILFNLE